MKKIKTLAVIISAAGLLSFTAPALATTSPFEVPEYDTKKAFQKVEGTIRGDMFNNEYELYYFDRNNDKKIDLIEANSHMNIVRPKMEKYDLRILYIDDDFDGKMDRILLDIEGKNGRRGMDGTYERQNEIRMGAEEIIKHLEKGTMLKEDIKR